MIPAWAWWVGGGVLAWLLLSPSSSQASGNAPAPSGGNFGPFTGTTPMPGNVSTFPNANYVPMPPGSPGSGTIGPMPPGSPGAAYQQWLQQQQQAGGS